MKKYTVIGALFLGSVLFVGCGNNTSDNEKEAPSRFLDYQTKTDLQFPIKGETLIFWGGRTIKENYHASTRDQRFALDIVALEKGHPVINLNEVNEEDIKTYNGDESKNENYYIFGREIVATGIGTIVSTRNNVVDNIPGEENENVPEGNNVVIDHGNGEFSMFAHLKYHSVVVHKGDNVTPGDVLGLCGNSGSSSEPHLHYHLQNTKEWLNAEGLPAQFQNYIANGNFVNRGEPVRGQIIIME